MNFIFIIKALTRECLCRQHNTVSWTAWCPLATGWTDLS